jgi:hypothetical protein
LAGLAGMRGSRTPTYRYFAYSRLEFQGPRSLRRSGCSRLGNNFTLSGCVWYYLLAIYTMLLFLPHRNENTSLYTKSEKLAIVSYCRVAAQMTPLWHPGGKPKSDGLCHWPNPAMPKASHFPLGHSVSFSPPSPPTAAQPFWQRFMHYKWLQGIRVCHGHLGASKGSNMTLDESAASSLHHIL